MKTNLNRTINTIEDAEAFLTELFDNGENFHPEDNAHDIEWNCIPEGHKPTPKECDKLNALMEAIYNLEGNDGRHIDLVFDPAEFLLDMEEDEERRLKQARPTEFENAERIRNNKPTDL